MRLNRIGIVGVAAAAMLASGAGLATASVHTASPAASGTEHFSLMTTSRTASKYVVIATGVFTAGGVDVSGSKVDAVKFPHGSFKINHGTAIHIIKQQLNQKTCVGLFEASAKFTVSGGTGAYKGISGSGKALITDNILAVRNKKGACNPNATPVVNEQTILGTAHVKL